MLECITSKCSAGQDLCVWDRMECSCEVFFLLLLLYLTQSNRHPLIPGHKHRLVSVQCKTSHDNQLWASFETLTSINFTVAMYWLLFNWQHIYIYWAKQGMGKTVTSTIFFLPKEILIKSKMWKHFFFFSLVLSYSLLKKRKGKGKRQPQLMRIKDNFILL